MIFRAKSYSTIIETWISQINVLPSLISRNIPINTDFNKETIYSYILNAIRRENAASICYEADESHANFWLYGSYSNIHDIMTRMGSKSVENWYWTRITRRSTRFGIEACYSTSKITEICFNSVKPNEILIYRAQILLHYGGNVNFINKCTAIAHIP